MDTPVPTVRSGPQANATDDTHASQPDGTAPTSSPAGGSGVSIAGEGELSQIGKYRLEALLGRGGMGSVYRGFDPELQRAVAVKVLEGAHPELISRFVREAQAQARVAHPNLCKVYDVGREGGRHFIAMQLIEGATLAQVARSLSLFEKVKAVREAAEGLHAAHKIGLVHRDVKPGNLLMERSDAGTWTTYVADFGLVRDLSASGETVVGQLLGTPGFMAPEQVRSTDTLIDRRTDVYGLGATLYATLTGEAPFGGPNLSAVLHATLVDEPLPLRRRNPTLPADLESIVGRCLEKNPARRYDSARELAEELQRFLEGAPVLARPVGRGTRLLRWAARNRPLAAALALGAASLLAAFGINLHSRAAAERRAQAEREFGQRIERLEEVMRHSHMLPLHDIAPERERVRAEMRSLAKRAQELGPSSAGVAHYAAGRGHLLLDELPEARAELEQAWSAGFQAPEEDAALGEVLARLYTAAVGAIALDQTDEAKSAQVAALRAELLEPAGLHLNRASGSLQSGHEAEYLRGFLAYSSGTDFPGALVHLQAAEAVAPPWFYEPRLVEGRALRRMATAERLAGNAEKARDERAQADAVLAQVTTIARSDPEALEAHCWVGIDDFWASLQHHDDPQPTFEVANRLCAEPAQADPSDVGIQFDRVLLLTDYAESLVKRSHPAGAVLAEATAILDAAEHQHPHAPGSALRRGGLLRFVAGDQENRGADPRPTLEQAIAAGEEARRADPSVADADELLYFLHRDLAEAQDERGLDCEPELARAVEAAHQLLRFREGAASSHLLSALAGISLALQQLARGRDPTAALDGARRQLDRCIELNPHGAMSFRNLARVETYRESYAVLRGLPDPAWTKRALGWLERGLASAPDNPMLLGLRVDVLRLTAREQPGTAVAMASLPAAAETANAMIAHDSGDPDGFEALALVQLEQADQLPQGEAALALRVQATASLEKVLALTPGVPSALAELAQAWERRAETLVVLKRPSAAEQVAAAQAAQAALAKNPRQAQAEAELGTLELLRARLEAEPAKRDDHRDAAHEWLKQALANDATLPVTYRAQLQEVQLLAPVLRPVP